MAHKIIYCSILAGSLILTGCQSNNASTGAAIGAITGAVLGKATGNHKDKRAVIGAAIGAIAGAAIGDYMDKQEQELRDELSGSGIKVVREGDTIRLIMPSNITYATGKSNITPDFYPTLDDIAKVMNKYDKTILSIEGHTDSDGAAQYNQQLSERRAQSVKNYLLGQNVIAARLYTTGFGESRPVANNSSAAGKAQNRRVEIHVVPNKA